ncbi:MAG TPA: methyl-accepting chemotaxis protein [Gemmatimonadaceae bacterium]|jgi:methyl-accepting chemotaxis protein
MKQLSMTETELATSPDLGGTPLVDVPKPSSSNRRHTKRFDTLRLMIRARPPEVQTGLLAPMVGMLQRRAAAVMVMSLLIFHFGIAWVCLRLLNFFTPEMRSAFFASPEVKSTLWIAAVWIVGLLALAVLFVLRIIEREVTAPVGELARLSEAVASGELAVPFTPSPVNSEVGRLSRATSAMILALRRLATTMRASARDTTSLSAQITAASESVATAAQETAATSTALSEESSQMATTLKEIAHDAAQLVDISGSLRGRAQEGLRREKRLRTLAQENRAKLDESSNAVEQLTNDARVSAESIEALATAVDEIRAFLVLIQKISRQSKLLSLNAAMEAARAGEHGEGFGIVADEVRRLAADSAEAAERTDLLARAMLERVGKSRDSVARTLTTLQAVQAATQHGRQSFVQVEQGVIDAESWSAAIETAVEESGKLVVDMTHRLENVALGTQNFASAMHQVATASKQQSTNIDEIAGAASSLSSASKRVAQLVGTFKLGDTPARGKPAFQSS